MNPRPDMPPPDPARVEQLLPTMQRRIDAGEMEGDAHKQAEWWAQIEASQWQSLVPLRFAEARVEQLEGPLRDAVEEWRQAPGRNLVLLGDVGVGKTHAAFAALRLVNRAYYKPKFYPVTELLDALRPGGERVDFDRLVQADYLALDDLGADRVTEWSAERLYTLVNRRWLDGRPIIATSNLSVSNGRGPLVDAVGERLYSRLVDDAVVVQVAGEDRRRQR